MSRDSLLRNKAREAIRAGRLPGLRAARLWGGPGCGACCTVCGEPVIADDVEFELEFARIEDHLDLRTGHLHMLCYRAWDHVCRKLDATTEKTVSNGAHDRRHSPSAAANGGSEAASSTSPRAPALSGAGADGMITACDWI